MTQAFDMAFTQDTAFTQDAAFGPGTATAPSRSRATALRDGTATGPLQALRASLAGALIEPSDDAYEQARHVFNLAFDRHPAAIVRAADSGDVIAAVRFAREHGMRLAVRAGGHSVPGYSTADDALVIDLSQMRDVRIDPERMVAWAEAGVTAGEYTRAAGQHGLATPFGDAASVGIAGLTLGGGIGFLVRKHGLTIDSLIAAEVVTADGRLVRASADENPDLFWALRGGGGNFGIVTSLEYRLHPVAMVYGGALILPATRDALRGIAPIAAMAPDELSVIVNVMAAPPAPFVPEAWHGRLVAVILGVHAGDMADGERAWAPFRSLATPVADVVGPMPYPAIYEFTRESNRPGAHAIRSLLVDAIDDATVDAILAAMARPTTAGAIVQLRVYGGAMARVPAEATAFASRGAAGMLAVITPFTDEATVAEHEAWTQALYEAFRPRAAGAYVNFLADEGEARIREAYPRETYERLATVKARWDPDNMFRLNQNIRPGH